MDPLDFFRFIYGPFGSTSIPHWGNLTGWMKGEEPLSEVLNLNDFYLLRLQFSNSVRALRVTCSVFIGVRINFQDDFLVNQINRSALTTIGFWSIKKRAGQENIRTFYSFYLTDQIKWRTSGQTQHSTLNIRPLKGPMTLWRGRIYDILHPMTTGWLQARQFNCNKY